MTPNDLLVSTPRRILKHDTWRVKLPTAISGISWRVSLDYQASSKGRFWGAVQNAQQDACIVEGIR